MSHNRIASWFYSPASHRVRQVLSAELHGTCLESEKDTPACSKYPWDYSSYDLVQQGYLKYYGLKFSKEDHIALIYLIYELVTIPDLEPYLVNKFGLLFIMLLKKRYLIPPKDLVLPWKPLFDLCERIMGSSTGSIGMYKYFSYFPEAATQEMLDLWRPMLCPFNSNTMLATMETLECFLPLSLPPEKAHLGYQLWFHEFMDLWGACHNAPIWEGEMMWLMARLANRNIGYIDWEPYIPLMFTRFLRSLSLPVVYKQTHATKHHKLNSGAMAKWIVAVLGGGSSAQKYLNKFMKTLESYFHPANFGHWLLKLKDFLRKLPYCFVLRVNFERYKKTWETQVPDSHKLTEDDITSFVESVQPVAMQAMFSKLGATDVIHALQHLATLRPSLIIPKVIERMYANLETLTEPHKLTAAMQCVVAVARPMVQGKTNGYKEGPTHVIPLLLATLPGIDPNDIRKCFVTLQFISTFATMIPFVDSSTASEHWKDLTEEEEIICLATADFEDFVLQFMDRCFILIENSSLEATRLEQEEDKRSKIENMAECALSSSCTALLVQTSPEIFKVNPKETLHTLVPHITDTILSLSQSDDILKEEVLDNELLYNMLILSQLLDCPGTALLAHLPVISKVLNRTLHLTCREGYRLATCLLRNLLSGLSSIVPLDYRSLPHPLDKPVKEYLPIRDWAKPGNINNLGLLWYVPGKEELACVQDIVSTYLPEELSTINKYINGDMTLTREELKRSLLIVISLLECKSLLPLWDEPPIKLMESYLPTAPFTLTFGPRDKFVTMPDGSNIRKTVADTMHRLQEKMLKDAEDDTKSFFNLVAIWESLMLEKSGSTNNFEARWKNFRTVKKVLENKVIGGKKHLRSLLVDRVVLQHEALYERSTVCLTETHRQIMLNLLTLSTSHYSEVRVRAQAKLFLTLDQFAYSYMILIPQLLSNLQQDSNQFHEQFKGSLYVLLGPKQSPVLARHDWSILSKLWPCIVRTQPSEKLSVIRLMEGVMESVHKFFPTITINMKIPETCVVAACKLSSQVDETYSSKALQILESQNKRNIECYLSLVNNLLDAIDHGNLHWRYHSMALSFLRDLVHPDVYYPASVVKCFLHTLIHDSLDVRKVAIRCLVFVLKQQKRSHKKVVVNTNSFFGDVGEPIGGMKPGPRPDNQWVQYSSENRPLSAEEWDKPRYLHKPYHGFYTWPKEVKIYAPSSEQPSLPRSIEDMNAVEQEVAHFFSHQGNVHKLVGFLSLEEKKGKDKFNDYRFMMFKGLFRNFGDYHISYFLPHLERLVLDKHESSQRCAAEILAGIIRGAKHWPFEMVVKMWDKLCPILKTAMANMTEETIADWGICFATASECRDPNRHHWLLELLIEDPLRDEASFIAAGRLYALQGALNQQEWRVSELFNRLLNYLKPYLTHEFQNVRDRLGSVLTNIFETDVVIGNGTRTLSPHISDFVAEIIPQLDILYNVRPKTPNHAKNHNLNKAADSDGGSLDHKNKADMMTKLMGKVTVDEKQDTAIRLLKTAVDRRWITLCLSRTQYGALPEYYQFFPLVCLMESYDADEEVGKTCTAMLAQLSQAIILPHHVPAALSAIKKVSESVSWCSRSTCLEFLQVLVFHNMATFQSSDDWVNMMNSIVLRLLEDDWLEVREKAAQVLGGLIHCDFLIEPENALETFKEKAKTKLKKKIKNNVVDSTGIELLKVRHAGILGLCAFINAYPYDVPEFMPEFFFILGQHLNDPQPIPSTIRKTLGDFKRTHHDNWEHHSLKFTEEQLAVLTDLTIPPSYYA
uniref:Proteasome activator subunit 4 n=1 Tax=Timema monikensis TaxID=170555 RepID=A0A7R9E2F8_9NEOP|nr:unnamed protein product [Timema monikensis]